MLPLEGTGPLGPLLPEHISELVIGVVLFIVIFFVARIIVVPRFEKMYSERTEAISGGIDRADQAQAEAAAALAQYKEKLAYAEDEAQQIREEARQTAVQISAEMKAKAELEAARIVSTARTQAEAEKSQVVDELRKDIGSMATTLAGKIVGEALDDDVRVKRTVDDFIASLDKETV